MTDLLGHFAARVGKLGSLEDPEPFDARADLGLPADVVVSAFGHGAMMGDAPVGHARVEAVGNDLIARGELWGDTAGGRETAAMLRHLDSRARFSVGYRAIGSRRPTPEESQRGVVRVLTKARLIELSPVLLPAEPSTRLLELKGTQTEVDALVKELHDHVALMARARLILMHSAVAARSPEAERDLTALKVRAREFMKRAGVRSPLVRSS